jgi:hypothetical protein
MALGRLAEGEELGSNLLHLSRAIQRPWRTKAPKRGQWATLAFRTCLGSGGGRPVNRSTDCPRGMLVAPSKALRGSAIVQNWGGARGRGVLGQLSLLLRKAGGGMHSPGCKKGREALGGFCRRPVSRFTKSTGGQS